MFDQDITVDSFVSLLICNFYIVSEVLNVIIQREINLCTILCKSWYRLALIREQMQPGGRSVSDIYACSVGVSLCVFT